MTTNSVVFVISGTPVAKGRPRFTRQGHVFTPDKTVKYEAVVQQYAMMAMQGRPLMEGPLAADMVFYMPIPPSWRKSKQDAARSGDLRPLCRNDVDNLCKGILDSCNAVVFHDDGQIVKLTASKWYGDTPHAVVTIKTLDAENTKAV